MIVTVVYTTRAETNSATERRARRTTGIFSCAGAMTTTIFSGLWSLREVKSPRSSLTIRDARDRERFLVSFALPLRRNNLVRAGELRQGLTLDPSPGSTLRYAPQACAARLPHNWPPGSPHE